MPFANRTAAAALLALLPSAALAGDCKEMTGTVPEADLWTCSAVYQSGTSHKSRTQCFADRDEGFTWVGQQFARADLIRQATCRNQGKTIRYRDWQQANAGKRG